MRLLETRITVLSFCLILPKSSIVSETILWLCGNVLSSKPNSFMTIEIVMKSFVFESATTLVQVSKVAF